MLTVFRTGSKYTDAGAGSDVTGAGTSEDGTKKIFSSGCLVLKVDCRRFSKFKISETSSFASSFKLDSVVVVATFATFVVGGEEVVNIFVVVVGLSPISSIPPLI